MKAISHATSTTYVTFISKLHFNFLTFLHSHIRTPFLPLRPWREAKPKPHPATAGSAAFTEIHSELKNNPFRLYPDPVGALRPWRESKPKPHPATAGSATLATDNSKLHSHFRTLRSSARFTETEQSRAAFSLTEVVIAMGVAAVAFTSIIGLFPLGLNMSKESYEDTQAALLAQTIFADCRDNLTGDQANFAQTSGFLIQVGSENSPINSASYINVTSFPSTIYIAYKQEPQTKGDLMLRPFKNDTNPASFYTPGTPGANAIAKIDFTFCFALSTLTNGPKKAEISIETPGDLPAVKRRQRIFSGGFQ